ncbi:MAG: TetR/AcrR family transcriptional regulator [Deltaproteobacteria bacterium]|nr:TetR/AcrR family transcriptional regulator [Deltaproteobacteria bacterium]
MEKIDKRQEIMKVAMELIAEQGFHGAPMSEIAEKAGVAAGTIYRYFQSKEALIEVMSYELESRLIAILMEGYPAETSVRERFFHIMTLLLQHFIAHPLHFRFMEQYHNSPYGVSQRRERLLGKSKEQDIVKKLIEEGIAKGQLKDLPLAVLSGLAFGSMIIIIQDHILGFVSLDEPLVQKIVEASWDAIKK